MSSSAKADDDIERKITRILETYQGSPVTTGNTNATDEAIDRYLMLLGRWCVVSGHADSLFLVSPIERPFFLYRVTVKRV